MTYFSFYRYVIYCMKLVDMLLSFGVKPILVFDGCTLPSKKEVEKSRREKRQTNLLKGKQLLREGKLSEAKECFSRSINITHAMACEVIKAARAQGIDCIVAPYEADAQLAYLNKTGIVQSIITEDSDLLAFGCKKVFLKIDKLGNGLEIDQARLGMCKQLGDVFTEEKFRYMCILSGCDYLPSIHGIGLGKACKLLKIANNPDIIKVIGKMGQYLKMNILVPDDYLQGFIRANNTFLYQLVFDPVRRKLVPLNAYENDIDPETLHYAGRHFGDSTAFQIALGNKDISTMEQIDNYNPDTSQPVQPRSRGWDNKCVSEKPSSLKSIWSRDYKPGFTASDIKNHESLLKKTTTRGMERLINTKGLNLPVKALLAKRPRLEELSEDDLLSQYFSNAKKSKTENEENGEHNDSASAMSVLPSSKDTSKKKDEPDSQPRPRNKFAFILQKKNEESGAVVVPGTRSRFFCSIMDLPDRQPKGKVVQTSQDCETTEAECTPVKDHSSHLSEAEELERTIPLSLGAAQTSCFSWTKSFSEKPESPSPLQSVSFLKRFHRQTPSKATSQNCNASQTMSSTTKELDEEASPLKEQGSLSEPELDASSKSNLDTSENSPVTKKNAVAGRESDHSSQTDCTLNSQISPYFESSCTDNKDTVLKSMATGFRKTDSVNPPAVMRCRSLVPAKVSGLSKKITKSKKKNHHDENKSNLQVTIHELWKTFQFKRDSQKLPSCKKTEPLSPVKDSNIQLTPDTDDGTFNKLEFSHVQRKIFQ
uniref:Exonuclease 1 n=1 Tax=Anolis carolinensis TaxID=28377 RepID=A0A803SVQ3_ANOCA